MEIFAGFQDIKILLGLLFLTTAALGYNIR